MKTEARLSADDVRARLRADIGSGTAKQWAYDHYVSQSFVSDVLSGRREPSVSILKALGLRRVVYFENDPSGLAGEPKR